MPLPLSDDVSRDVLEGAAPEPRLRWPAPRLLVGGALDVAPVAGGALFAARDDPPAGVDASGSIVLEDESSRLVTVPHSTQVEGREAVWTGTIRLDLPDGQLVGDVVQRCSWAATVEDDVIMISHSWGRLSVTFGRTTCSGRFGKSSYRDPRETGGALVLRCDDGSLLAATMTLMRDEDPTLDHPFRVFSSLDDGSYVAA